MGERPLKGIVVSRGYSAAEEKGGARTMARIKKDQRCLTESQKATIMIWSFGELVHAHSNARFQ